ncbi:serine/threonine-protein kinase DCLK1-like isoform X1 [Tachypleus tridentatus]|uniref:serine/threonine-protein kinase DCLK1-like isoform X1 n=1 Tax=Tachypleus tridentatus TaxID=6853 RepID=UPI003FD1EA5F
MATDMVYKDHFSSIVSRSGSGGKDRREAQQNVFRPTRNGRTSPTHSAHGCLMRTSLQKLSQEKKAKKVKFYRNGDKFFKGLFYALSSERARAYDTLLEDLTRCLVDQVNLPKGVRYIFSEDGKEKITSLDQFKDGCSYVCSSTDSFEKLDYSRISHRIWNVQKKQEEDLTSSRSEQSSENSVKDSKEFIKPKLITVIRNGVKPRKAVRILLNKKTARSFDQVLNDITDSIKLDSGAVRKVFSLSGKQVVSLADFFGEEEIFIAYGPEKYSHDDFDLDSEECRYLTNITRSSTMSRKLRRSIGNPLSPTPQRRVSSPAHHYEYFESPVTSGKSSRAASPKSPRKVRPKSPGSQSSLQNGHLSPLPSLPRQITQLYDVGRLIGDGNFAVVHHCIEKVTQKEFALKIIDKTKCAGKEHLIASEVAIMRRVKHPNIVHLHEEFDVDNELYLVMELVKGGDLFDAIASATKYTERDASGMVYNLASALLYLHCMNIVHRDIKPENLLVVEHEDSSKSLKLGDFGLAVEAKEPLFVVCGTPTYVAPEILAETGYGLKVDIWAAGVITYILLSGFPPFVSETNDQDELFDQILAGKFEFTSPFWDDISDSAKELISNMLQVDPQSRFSASQVLEHPWVAADTARDNDMHLTVSRKLSMHFDHKPKSSLQSAGIALIASTALDKGPNYFNYHHQNKSINIHTSAIPALTE